MSESTDPTTEQMQHETGHSCLACPIEVRDLYATAYNLLNWLDVAREEGDWSGVWRRAEVMRGSVTRVKTVMDTHFDALNAWRRP